MNTIFAIGSIFLPFTIEKFGRRNILLYSAAGLTICLSVFVAMIGSPNPTLVKQWVAVGAIIVYNLIFGYGWIGVCWLYGPEVSTLSIILFTVEGLELTVQRFLLCNFVTLEVPQVHLVSGFSALSLYLPEGLVSRKLDGSCGFGAFFHAPWQFHLFISCARRQLERPWKRLICCFKGKRGLNRVMETNRGNLFQKANCHKRWKVCHSSDDALSGDMKSGRNVTNIQLAVSAATSFNTRISRIDLFVV